MQFTRILVITPLPILGHLFHIIDPFFPGFTFHVAEVADMAYIMFQEGNFDVVFLDPYIRYSNELNEEMLTILKEISNNSDVPVACLSHLPIPENLKHYFNLKVSIPFDKPGLDKSLIKISELLNNVTKQCHTSLEMIQAN